MRSATYIGLSALSQIRFQSTHSMRSATKPQFLNLPILIPFQSTHSMRSATKGEFRWSWTMEISIHALHAECDMQEAGRHAQLERFQSTHSMRSATMIHDNGGVTYYNISIHALHAECDPSTTETWAGWHYFNPRTPCGVRLVCGYVQYLYKQVFQSTHSMRSATLSLMIC